MHLLIQATIAGVLVGGVYALLASGQAMIFGVTRTVNFAQAIFAIRYALAIAHNGAVLDAGVVRLAAPAAELLDSPEVARLYLGTA